MIYQENSNNIPVTTIVLDMPTFPGQLKKIRGAVAEQAMVNKQLFDQAGLPTDLFHNHHENKTGEESKMWRYPLIQYKIRHRKTELIGLGKGAQALQLWSLLSDRQIKVDNKEMVIDIKEYRYDYWRPQLGQKLQTYRLNKWLAFNPQNYELWQQTPRLADKAAILDKLLWGHCFHMAEGLGFELDREQLHLHVSTIDMMTYKDCFSIKKLALDITFHTNLHLPEEIGLGQGVTIGFGKVQQIKDKKSKSRKSKSASSEANEVAK